MSLVDKLNYYSTRKSFKYGIPFLIMMVAGSFGLQQFSNLRLAFKNLREILS